MKKIRRFYAAALMSVLLLTGIFPVKVLAASGTVYSCTITPSYRHPVTGVIEDSGGEASYVTGQGMVNGCVYTSGMLEVTDAGEYYLTFRMSLVDYTTNHTFQVQKVGDSGWSSTGMAVTAQGSDTNGTTADICIQVPSESCIVRGSMYVTPMGRNVIFYFYPGNYTEGNSVGMTPTQVTEASTGAEVETQEIADAPETETQAATETRTEVQTQAPALESSLDNSTPAAASTESEASGTLNQAQGLSLSTAPEDTADTGMSGSSTGMSAFGLGAAITMSGIILIAVAAAVVYYFRVNWRRWGGGDDDED